MQYPAKQKIPLIAESEFNNLKEFSQQKKESRLDIGAKAIFSRAYEKEITIAYYAAETLTTTSGIVKNIDTREKKLLLQDTWISMEDIHCIIRK